MTAPLESHLDRQIEHSADFFWHRLRWRAIARLLPADRPFELVDVGAGAGLLGHYMARDFPAGTYRFVEPIASLEQHLESQFGPSANARHEAVYETADFVTLLDVVEHQPDGHAFMAEVLGRMRPHARLIVTVPAMQGLWSYWDEALGHHMRYDRSTFRAAVEGLPGRLVVLRYLFPEMLPAALIRRRRLPSGLTDTDGDESNFPDLPKPLNLGLLALGIATQTFGRWPAGTSLMAVIDKEG